MSAKKSTPPQDLEVIAVKVLTAVKPGDTVFLECKSAYNSGQMEHLHQFFKRTLPDIRIVILQAGITVVAKPDEFLGTKPQLS